MSFRMMRKEVVKGMLDMVFLYLGSFLQFSSRHLWSVMSKFSVRICGKIENAYSRIVDWGRFGESTCELSLVNR